jgi:predicted DNA-binding transcriptional regulator YafY
MARTRRNKAAAKRSALKAARTEFANLGVKGKTARFSYHSAGKDEITVRVVDVMTAELRISKKGATYIRAYDRMRGDWRSFTPARIGWAVAA